MEPFIHPIRRTPMNEQHHPDAAGQALMALAEVAGVFAADAVVTDAHEALVFCPCGAGIPRFRSCWPACPSPNGKAAWSSYL